MRTENGPVRSEAAGGDQRRAYGYLDAEGHSGISAALSGATESAGGVTIPRPMTADLIELLRARVVVRAAGALTFPMPAGQIRHARQTASATATYIAENAPIPESQPEFGALDQSFKKLTGLVPIGNSLLRHSGIAMTMAVRDDLVRVMARREDLAFIRGTGTGNTPREIRNWLLAANWIAGPDVGVAATAAAAETALRTVVSRVTCAESRASLPGGWIARRWPTWPPTAGPAECRARHPMPDRQKAAPDGAACRTPGGARFEPMLRAPIPAGTILETARPTIYARFASADEGKRGRGLMNQSEPVTLSFVEAFDR